MNELKVEVRIPKRGKTFALLRRSVGEYRPYGHTGTGTYAFCVEGYRGRFPSE